MDQDGAMALQDTALQLSGSHTVASQIYTALRERIIRLELRPGATMSEQEVAKTLGVSRTPVREAFIRLSREKMLIISPQRRTAVAKISTDRVQQERFLRESLEVAVLKDFIPMADEAALRQLEQNLSTQREAVADKDYLAFLDLDDAFHKLFYTASGHELCHHVMRRNCFDYRRMRLLSHYQGEETTALNLRQHEQLLALIREKDVSGAMETLLHHLRRANDDMRALKEAYGDYFA